MESGSAISVQASEVLARWYAAWNAHDTAAISDLLTEDVTYEDPAGPAPVMHGREDIAQYTTRAFRAIPDLHLEKLEEWVTDGDEVIASYFRITGTFKESLEAPGLPPLAPTGQPIDLQGMDRSVIRDGRLARHQIFWDTTELGRQLGAFPPRGSRAEKASRRLQHLTAWRLRRTSNH